MSSLSPRLRGQVESLGQWRLPSGEKPFSSTPEFKQARHLVGSMNLSQHGRDDVQLLRRMPGEEHSVLFMSGRQETFSLPAGATAANLIEAVADRFNEALDDDDPHDGIDASQVQLLSADGKPLDPSLPVPEDAGQIHAVIRAEDWMDDAQGLPARIRSLLCEWSDRLMLSRGREKWEDAGEFGALVKCLANLCEPPTGLRGGGPSAAMDEEVEVSLIFEFLERATSRKDACPASVHAELKLEYGLEG